MKRHTVSGARVLGVVMLSLVAGCGSSDNGTTAPSATATLPRTATPPATATPVRSATALPTATATLQSTVPPTATPTGTVSSSAVSVLLVLNHAVTANADDALAAPPASWTGAADTKSFDRALSNADWAIDGSDAHGITGTDGRFTITGLTPGQHTLRVAKTLAGNLAAMQIPFVVGDDGSAQVVGEVAWGLVKSTSTYTQGGAPAQTIYDPNGSWLTVRASHIAAFGDTTRTYTDPEGDGTFTSDTCPPPWTCTKDPSCVPGQSCPCIAVCPTCTQPPYACEADGSCATASDRCVCLPSCPECDDCASRVCVSSCPPIEIVALSITAAPSQLIIGQQGSAYAVAQLSDGSQFNVTYLADWQASDPSIASIDSWGTVTGVAVGSVNLTAAIGGLTSAPWPLDVVERPTLRRIDVQNASCFYPLGVPTDYGSTPPIPAPPAGSLPPIPSCTQVVQIGGTLQFRAVGTFDNGYYQDITDEVQWQITPPEIGEMVGSLFTARQAGTGTLTAALGSVVSDATEIRVVTQPTVVALSIYTSDGVIAFAGPPMVGGVAVPCIAVGPGQPSCCCPGPLSDGAPCDCGYSLTVLKGDQLKFHATAQFDTGEWRDVTDQVTWQSSGAAATIDPHGVMTAADSGDAGIDAVLGDVTSNTITVHVVDHATIQSLSIYQQGTDRVVAKSDQLSFAATAYYDVGFGRDVTATATWHTSDNTIGGFDTPGVLTGRSAGTVQVWAELDGQQSNSLSVEVFETSELTYCDPNNINRVMWSDDFNRVTLESDCANYSEPGVASLRYTVTQLQPRGGIFDPCLDLNVVAPDGQRVRTIRNEGCGDPFLAAGAPNRDQEVLKYQLRAFWDLKDDAGQPVAPGQYIIVGRFYLYYDPIVSLNVTVLAPGQPTPTPQPTLTATPEPLCTPPPCLPGEALFCPSKCPGGCGTICVAQTPTTSDPIGICFTGSSDCTGTPQKTLQSTCCARLRLPPMPLPTSWCPTDQLSANGECAACTSPCPGVDVGP